VSLVAILDADKEGFLRAERSLIQTIGRAARNVRGTVIMYADRMTDSMNKAITVTRARRATQEAHNAAHGITPKTIEKSIQELAGTAQDDFMDLSKAAATSPGKKKRRPDFPIEELPDILQALRKEMHAFSDSLEFEKAAAVRDRIKELEELQLAIAS
jgi:excinuclease ABC subunit B